MLRLRRPSDESLPDLGVSWRYLFIVLSIFLSIFDNRPNNYYAPLTKPSSFLKGVRRAAARGRVKAAFANGRYRPVAEEESHGAIQILFLCRIVVAVHYASIGSNPGPV
jgi:hypothetical protein